MMRLDLATDDFIGARSQQQDAAAARSIGRKGGAILVLADGLGGHTGGAEASRIVVETFSAAADTGIFDEEAGRRPALRETLEKANERIADGVEPAHGQRGMASTAVAVVLADGLVNWISVGDSHLYVWRRGRLAKLNEDHSQAGLMVRSGQYKADDPEVAAAKSVLVSALTGRKLEIVDHPAQAFAVQKGDVVLLASDGLNTLSETEIEAAVTAAQARGASQISTTLLDHIRDRRADRQDNTAVVVARIVELPDRAHDVPTQLADDTQRITAPTTIASAAARLEGADHQGQDEADKKSAIATGSVEATAELIAAARPAKPHAGSGVPEPAHPATAAGLKPQALPPNIASTEAKTEAAAIPRRKLQAPVPPVRQSRLPPGLIGNMIIALAVAAIAAGTYLFWKPKPDALDTRPAVTKPEPGVTVPPTSASPAPPAAETPPKALTAPPVAQPQTQPLAPQGKQPAAASPAVPSPPVPSPAVASPPATAIDPVRAPLPTPSPTSEPTRTPGAAGAPAPGQQAPSLVEPPSPVGPRGSLQNLNQTSSPAARALLPNQR